MSDKAKHMPEWKIVPSIVKTDDRYVTIEDSHGVIIAECVPTSKAELIANAPKYKEQVEGFKKAATAILNIRWSDCETKCGCLSCKATRLLQAALKDCEDDDA